MKLQTSEIIFREDLYPRFRPNPSIIQSYSENIDQLPPVEVNQHNELIDGYHRWKAFETVGMDEIDVQVTETKSEAEFLQLAIARNAKHGQQLTREEKKDLANRLFFQLSPQVICETLAISDRTFRTYTAATARQRDAELNRKIFELWLSCRSQQHIAESLQTDQARVSRVLEEVMQNGKLTDLHIFRDFEGTSEDSGRRIYTVWNFPKANNEVRHFGNIPPEIIENLLFLYTKPFDLVFDPFGGGGSTIDKCRERKRRYYVSDLNPIPARPDIRRHDVTQGLPDDLPVPDFVFLDPPYWRQAEGKYSQDPTDLANIDLDLFLKTIGELALGIKRKWSGAKRDRGYLALIIGPWKENGKMVDLPFLCYERIQKYLPLVQRIIVPYSTQVHGGAYVDKAKENKELLYLHRDLMVFAYGV